MKVVLSRKGFDSKNGGIASPILPDGTLLSLPIPGVNGTAYSDLSYSGETYKEMIEWLGAKCGSGVCHLDPDIRQGIFDAPAEWKPAFGQSGRNLTHLNAQKIGSGDLILFFGWFRQVERIGSKLRYVPKSPNLHIIFGYLQIGDMITSQAEIDREYSWHPHANMKDINNCLYIPRDTCSWDNKICGYGVFSFDKKRVLTKGGMSRACWNLPDLHAFDKKSNDNRPNITHSYKDSWRTDPQYGEYYRSADIGQEFVIEKNPDVETWARSLI